MFGLVTEDFDGSGYACCATIISGSSGVVRRCGRKTYKRMTVGANGVSVPYCQDHMPNAEDALRWFGVYNAHTTDASAVPLDSIGIGSVVRFPAMTITKLAKGNATMTFWTLDRDTRKITIPVAVLLDLIAAAAREDAEAGCGYDPALALDFSK